MYEPDRRSWRKVKHTRTADCVVAGYRLHKTSTPEEPLLGSMLLGLYNDEGVLQHVGVCAAFTASRRAELAAEGMAAPACLFLPADFIERIEAADTVHPPVLA